jgi:hypothetical protein
MDTWGAPQWIIDAHAPDQGPQIGLDLRPTAMGSGFPAPIPAKAGTMPAHDGLGPVLFPAYGISPCRRKPIADCSGIKKAPALKARASYRRRNMLPPHPKKPGPARQKSFSLFTAYLREYCAKILKTYLSGPARHRVHLRQLKLLKSAS